MIGDYLRLHPSQLRAPLEARSPVLLHGSSGDWEVSAGFVDLFATQLDDQGDAGRRLFLVRLQRGERLSGLPQAEGPALIAVGGQDSELMALPEPLAGQRQTAWLQRLSQALAIAEEPLSAAAPASPLLTVEDIPERIAVLFRRRTEREAAAAQRRRELANLERAQGIAALAEVLLSEPVDSGVAADDPVVECLKVVAAAIGAELAIPARSGSLPPRERVHSILSASDLRCRRVLLRGQWWRDDHGPLLGWAEDDGRPLALVPGHRGYRGSGYQCVDPGRGTREELDVDRAARVNSEALMVYPCLSEKPQRIFDLMRFAGRGAGGDVTRIVGYGLLGALMAVVIPLAIGTMVDHVLPSGDRGQLLVIGLLILGVGVGGLSFSLVSSFARMRLEARADVRVQTALFDRMLRLPLALLKKYPVGDLADRLLGMQQVREQLTGATLRAMISMVFSVTSLVVLFFYIWQLALAALVLAAVYAVVVISLVWRQLRHERDQAEARGQVQGFTTQMIIGIGKLRVAHAEGRAFGVWARMFARQKRHFMASGRVSNHLGVFLTVFSPLSTAVVFAGIVLLADHLNLVPGGAIAPLFTLSADKAISTGMFVAFNAAFGQFLSGAGAGVSALSDALSAIPQLERARPLLNNEVESRRKHRDPGRLNGALEFSNVSFRYSEDGPLVLDRMSFHIAEGEFVAIVGPSGSGKSTIQRLMMGLETPISGEVRFDGQSLALLDRSSVRRQLGVVLQQTTLPGGPLYKIILGDRGGSLEEAWAAARQAALEEDIRAMPMGMHTVMQDGAAALSGGQRQRLAIARALARQPRILLLDEATSALDNVSQALVSRTLVELEITRVLVAHRLSTIRQTDRILVIDHGLLVEKGCFEDLISAGGVFSALASRQLL